MSGLQLIGDTIELDGYKVGTLNNDVPASVRHLAEVKLGIVRLDPPAPKQRKKGKRK